MTQSVPVPSPRVLPHDLDAEKSVLGAILVDGDRLVDVAEILAWTDFYRVAHGLIYARMVDLSERRSVIDFITLKDALARRDELEEVGGPAYIAALADGVPRNSSVAYYAGIVKEKAELRALITAANKILARAYEAEEDAATVGEEAERLIFQLATKSSSGGFVSMRVIAQEGLAYLETVSQNKSGITGVPSGFVDLDAMTRGFQPSNLIIVAARPSMGKTSLAINIAQNMSRVGKTVGIFSLEMSNSELFIRQLAAEAHIDSHRVQSGFIRSSEWGPISMAIGVIAESKIFVDESPYIGAFEMRGRARRLKAEHGLDALFIDYLQLMASPQDKRSQNRTIELGDISRALKGLAKELQIPVIALSQLSRAPDARDDHRPRLSDLRDSGAIEQDADLVLFPYRASVYEETEENRRTAELIIGKHRNGSVGTVKLGWIPEETRFVNRSEYSEPADQRLPIGDR